MVLTLRDRAKSLVWVTTILFLGYSTTFFDGATSLQHQYHSYRTGIIRVKDGFGSTHTQGTGVIQGNEKVQSLNCERFRSVHRLFVTSETFTVDNSISTAHLLHKQRFKIPPLFAYRGNKYVSPVMEDRLKRGLLTSADLDRYYMDNVNLQLTIIFKCRIFCFGLISSVTE